MFHGRFAAGFFLCGAGLLSAAPVPERPIPRRLDWDELAVDARLDADGRLHVTERQAIFLSGDWNGAERRFRLDPDQTLTLDSIERRGPGPADSATLSDGSLSEMDRFAWVEPGLLRWRSRAPQDPPFRDTRIEYVLRYVLAGVVQRRPRGYRLDHDFAFSEREGVIRRFTLDLRLDPTWRAESAVPRDVVGGPLMPGYGWRVVLPLEYTGPGWPAAVAWRRFALHGGTLAALVVVPLFMVVLLLRRERGTGRLGASSAPPVSRADLERDVFAHAPEVIGAAWDEDVGATEVGALVARMVQEGKLRSEVMPSGNLSLQLLVRRDILHGYERALVDGFFVDGNATNTEKIRSHYRARGTGFDPALVVRLGILERVQQVVGRDPSKASWLRWVLAIAAVAAGIALMVLGANEPEVAMIASYGVGGMVMLVGFSAASSFANTWRVRLDRAGWHTVFFLLPAMVILAVPAAFVLRRELGVSDEAAAGVGLLALTLFAGVIGNARSRHSRGGLALRRQMLAARAYFIDQLRRPQPELDDAWFPYLVAFGLDDQVQEWFRAHPGRQDPGHSDPDISYPPTTSSTTTSSSPSGPTWTGGGGSFGGAGATGTWVAALGGVTAGVAAPSSSGGSSGSGSSSGGGGTSGGGSSSGGGGGGGW